MIQHLNCGLPGSSACGDITQHEWIGIWFTESFFIFLLTHVKEILHLAYSKPS